MTPNRRLKHVRELRGWSQAKVAEQIGTDATTVSRWERGLFSPTPYFRERLCTLFDKNAEELGLLDAEVRSAERVQQVPSSRPSGGISTSLQENQDWSRADLPSSMLLQPDTPSKPLREDTFAYILQSAAYDQQAYMLWEDAYVRAIRGQRTEAQQLGEASLNVFEHVGHPNAEALREWLKKNELYSPPPMPPMDTPSAPLPLLPKSPKRSILRFFRWRSTSIALISLVIAVLCFVGFSYNQLYISVPGVQALVQVPPTPKATVPARLVLKSTPRAVATTQIVSTPTTRPVVPTPTSIVDPPVLMLTITPASLKPANCVIDSGYRCTLNIVLFSTVPGNLNWTVSSTNLPAKFSPGAGEGSSGSSYQVIVYIQSGRDQSDQLIFVLSSASYNRTFSVPWKD